LILLVLLRAVLFSGICRMPPLLDDVEAEQFREFYPEVKDPQSWQPPPSVVKYLEKHFNKTLTEADREAILSEYPIPDCAAVNVPKLDTEVMEQLKSKGKDPHFGAEWSLYRIQEQLLEVTGPLTSLWVDFLGPDRELTKEEVVHQIQRALVLVGSTFHAINVERRKVAWARINPKLKSLAVEDYKDRESNLFGPGFLEKASKKLEDDKALAKVSQDGSGSSRKRPYEDDPKDLRCFLSKGAPAQYGSKGKHCQSKPFNSQPKNWHKKPQNTNRKPATLSPVTSTSISSRESEHMCTQMA